MILNIDSIKEILAKVNEPDSGKNIFEAGLVGQEIYIDDDIISFSLVFENPEYEFKEGIRGACVAKLKEAFGSNITVKISIINVPKKKSKSESNDILPDVKNIIAISSGKGGVGKSTISVNLAVTLAKQGYKVGLLDADVYGPSIPKMFDLEGAKPETIDLGDKQLILPFEKYGVKLLSIGFFVNNEDAMVWRGPMATTALKQLITDAEWGVLDYLLIDLPPGTSDIHLTLVQTISLTGAVIVTTPQNIALADVFRGLKMFRLPTISVPIIGLIENMSWFSPAELPNNKYYIFGEDGGKKLAQEQGINLLGQIPFVLSVRENADKGHPEALNDSVVAKQFELLAKQFVEKVNIRNIMLEPTQRVGMSK